MKSESQACFARSDTFVFSGEVQPGLVPWQAARTSNNWARTEGGTELRELEEQTQLAYQVVKSNFVFQSPSEQNSRSVT